MEVIILRIPYISETLLKRETLLKSETLDRLKSVVDSFPNYKKDFEELINNFSVYKTLKMLNVIHKDKDYKNSKYYNLYNVYFDEIEELIFINEN